MSLLAFIAGAVTTTLLINWARRQELRSSYALALLLEAALLLVFGLVGANLTSFAALLVPTAVLLLCFIMGLQNAVITKVSHAEIRTTHVTGLLTDLGIELGKLLYINRSAALEKVDANRVKLKILSMLIGSFCGGALFGAFGFKFFGYISTVPLALALVVVVWGPISDDVRHGRFAPGTTDKSA